MMSNKSEKSSLSHQELTKHLDENSPAIREQEEEWRRIQSGSGCSEKIGLPDSLSCENTSSIDNDPSKMASLSTNASFLHSPPPSYFGSSMPPLESNTSSQKSVKTETADSFQVRSSTGDYRNLLIKDLRFETRRQLGLHLDLEHPNVKNWKNLADEIGFSNLEIQNFDNGINKTQRVLNEAEVRYSDITVGNLCEILADIDRLDVLTDIEPLFVKDASKPRRKFGSGNSISSQSGTYSFPTASSSLWNRDFSTPPPQASLYPVAHPPPPFPSNQGDRQTSMTTASTMSLQTSRSNSPVQVASVTTTASLPVTESGMQSLNEKGNYPMTSPQTHPQSLPPDYDYPAPQRYDAFVLYDVADKQFILSEFLPKVETEAGLKLFIPGRDSPAGDHFYDAQLETMMTSCPKLIVIQSDEFLRSPMSRWSLNIALALDPAARRRKIIPVVYKRVTEPSILAGINACDRTRVLEDSWFWDGIVRSLKQNR